MEESRRVKLTKACLKQALLELLARKLKDKISISEVCESADVNRSTFYAYYNDITELLGEIENEVIAQFAVTLCLMDEDEQLPVALTALFENIKANDEFFRVLMVRSGSDEFNQKLIDNIYDRYKDEQNETIDGRYLMLYRINGVIGMIKRWITENFPIPPKDLAQLVLKITA